MINLRMLQGWTDHIVDLFFEDGQAVRVKLILVDLDIPEIIYDILEVLSPGPKKYWGLAPGVGTAAAADPRELIQAVRRE